MYILAIIYENLVRPITLSTNADAKCTGNSSIATSSIYIASILLNTRQSILGPRCSTLSIGGSSVKIQGTFQLR